MDWIKWVFDGIGTALLVLIITGVSAGVYYKKVVKTKQIQKQKGGDGSTLYQAGKNITKGKSDE